MTNTINWSERRQFGRRPLNADAVAELPGQIAIPCVIENLSEGGALLSFPTGVAPIHLFDLTLEAIPFRIPCEMRYQVGIRFGVRFKRIAHGEALILHFFGAAVTPSTPSTLQRRAAERPATPETSIRQLRANLLPLIASETARTTDLSGPAAAVQPSSGCAVAEPERAVPPSVPRPAKSVRPSRLVTRR